MKNRLFIGFMLFAVLIMAACCKDKCSDPANPDCGNYDACYGKKPVSAAFKIQEVLQRPTLPNGWGESFDTDTITTYAVQFTALEEGAEYEWHIGSEVLTGKSISKTNFPLGGTYPITLIVKKTPDKACFPNDDGKDTVTRKMVAANWLLYSPIIGKFKGKVTNPDDTLTIVVRLEKFDVGGILQDALIPYNWGCKNNDCNFGNGLGSSTTFKKVYCDFSYIKENCRSPIGIFEIRGTNNDTLVINYTEFKPGSTDLNDRITRKFVGIRQK